MLGRTLHRDRAVPLGHEHIVHPRQCRSRRDERMCASLKTVRVPGAVPARRPNGGGRRRTYRDDVPDVIAALYRMCP